MSRFNKIVAVIQAHPDDAEAWCSGTLALLKKKGFAIHIATMTAGGLGGIGMTVDETIATRKQEAAAAAKELGAESYFCFDQPDGYVYDNAQTRVAVTSWLRRVEAGIVMTHLPNDYHGDHRATATIVESAAMVATLPNVDCPEPPMDITPLLYHTPPMTLSDPVGGPLAAPDFFVDISSTLETKMAMLSHHQTQQVLMKVMHKMDDFFGEMKKFNVYLGGLAGVEFAECFWQHKGGGFQKDQVLQEVLAEYIPVSMDVPY